MKLSRILFLCFLITVFCSTSALGKRSVVQIDLKEFDIFLRQHDNVSRETLDVIGINRINGTTDVLIDEPGQLILNNSALKWTEIKTESDLRNERIDDSYLDYNEVTAALGTYQSSYPAIAQRMDLGTSSEGRTIWGMKISDNVATDENEPEVLFVGLHQAREIMSTEIAMDMIDYLLTNYSGNPDVADWVQTWQIWIIPMLNPDGSAYCWSDDQYWTKNRRDFGSGVYGVDIGHNYPFAWGSCFGSSSDPNSNSYRGPEAASEPEVQAVLNLAQEHHFLAVLSYHSFNEMVLIPYGCFGETPPDKSILQHFGNRFASEIQRDDGGFGYSVGTWWELLYSNDGNETDYFYAEHGSLSYAVEVNASSYYPEYSLRDPTVQRNRAGWQEVLDLFNTGNVISGVVTDACTSEPLEAEYWFAEFPPSETEAPRVSDPETGEYLAVGRPGNLTLVLVADGYLERAVPLHFNNSPLYLDIDMLLHMH